MTPEQQRIAIAEVVRGRKDNYAGSRSLDDLPDYVNDLNAMHEAEKVLPNTPNSRWRVELESVCGTMANMLRATASQRAEAFLRTLGLWVD